MSFLTPGFFDALVLITVVVGLIAAVIQIRRDFRRGPRWPEKPPLADERTDSEGDTGHA